MGKLWENILFSTAFRQGLLPIRIEDGSKTVGGKLIRVQQKFDFIIAAPNAQNAFIDTKTCKAARYSCSMVKTHQIESLAKLEAMGNKAGYLVLFQECNKVVFFKASLLKNLQSRESLGPEMGKMLGSELNFNLKMIFEPEATLAEVRSDFKSEISSGNRT